MRNSIIQTRSQSLNSNRLNSNTKSYADVTKLLDVKNSNTKQNTTNEIVQTENKTLNNCLKPTSQTQLIYPKIESETILHVDELWFEDAHIEAYLNSFTEYIKKFRNDVLLLGPNLSQMLKHSTNNDILTQLTSLSFEKINIALFCINNHYVESEATSKLTGRGCHWSLLVYSRVDQAFVHYDSISGSNRNQAQILANKINPDFAFFEEETVQQTDGYSCGIHLLVNSKCLIDKFISNKHESKLLHTNSDRCEQIIQDIHPNAVHKKNSNCKLATNSCKQINKLKHNQVFYINQTKDMFSDDTLLESNEKHFDDVEQTFNRPTPSNSNDMTKNNSFTTHSSKKHSSKYKTLLFSNNFLLPCSNKYSLLSEEVMKESKEYEDINTICSSKVYSKSQSKPRKCLSKENKSQIKLLTDSHGRGIRNLLSSKFDNTSVNVSSCIKPNGTVKNVLNEMENEVKRLTKKDYVVIAAGTNDVDSYMVNQSCIASHIEDKIKELVHTNFIITALPYRYDESFLNNKIKRINNQLEQFCKKYNHINYLSLRNINRYDYTSYGLHLNKIGKSKYVDSLYNLVNEVECLNNNSANIAVRITQRQIFLEKRHILNVHKSYPVFL
jgi:sentrin-specific protease 8